MRARVLGINTEVVGLGPFVVGGVAQALDGQWIFWANVPIGVVAIVLVLARIEESIGANARLDLGGLVLVLGRACRINLAESGYHAGLALRQKVGP